MIFAIATILCHLADSHCIKIVIKLKIIGMYRNNLLLLYPNSDSVNDSHIYVESIGNVS